MKKMLVLALCSLGLIGCATALSDPEIKNNTASVLGVPSGDITTIKNKKETMDDIKYVAVTKQGREYDCSISASLFKTDKAVCKPKAK